MKDQWKGFALSLAVGLIMGGGATMAVGSHNLSTAVKRLEEQIEKVAIVAAAATAEVKADEKKTFEGVYELTMGMVRLEEQLKAANEKLDALAR